MLRITGKPSAARRNMPLPTRKPEAARMVWVFPTRLITV